MARYGLANIILKNWSIAMSKPKASQQFLPVAEQDAIYKAIAKAEAKGKTRKRDIEAELAHDKATIEAGDYWNANQEYFSQFRKQQGE